jgi:hypothetical protein
VARTGVEHEANCMVSNRGRRRGDGLRH